DRATGGAGGNGDAQRPGNLPGHDVLRLVPGGERGDGVGDVGEPDVELLGPPAGVVDDDVRQHGAPPGEGRGVVQVEDEVLGDREGGDDAAGRAVLGDEAEAGAQPLLDRRADH